MQQNQLATPLEFIEEWIEHFKKKSSHNKLESLWCFRLVMFCSISAPMLLSLGDTILVSKVAPSVLSGIAAFCTAWLQLRKPQVLWSSYKTSQRELEVLKAKYQYKVDDFSDLPNEQSDQLLIKHTTILILKTNSSWVNQVADYTTRPNQEQ